MKLFEKYTDEEIKILLSANKKKIKTSGPMKRLLQVRNRIKLFHGISEESLIAILKNVEFKKFKKGESIIIQNSISREVYFILMGQCNVFVNKQLVGQITFNQVIGEVAAMFPKPRNASVLASKDNTATLSFELNEEALKKYPNAMANIYKNLAKELIVKLENLNQQKTK